MDQVHDTEPYPKRFWWFKRFAVVAAIVVVGLFCLRWWWGAVSHRHLTAEIERIRAAGEPILFEDFAVEPVDDDDNAALFLQRAAAAWDDSRKESGSDREYLEGNAKAMLLVRQARTLSGCDWGIKFSDSALLVTLPLPHLSDQRSLATGLSDVAKRQHRMGDDVAAIETVRDILFIGDMIERNPQCLLMHLVGSAMRRLAMSTIEDISYDLSVNSATHPSQANDSVPRRRLESFMYKLLDERYINERHRAACWGERGLFCLSMGRAIASGNMSLQYLVSGTALSIWDKIWMRLFRPMVELDTLYLLRFWSTMANAVSQPNLTAFQEHLPEDPEIDSFTRPLSSTMLLDPEWMAKVRFREHAMRRMAVVALALRCYQVDKGERPDKLDALLPTYLREIPPDPLSVKGRAIGYETAGDEGPYLYSGDPEQTATHGERSSVPGADAYDIQFYLDGRPDEKEFDSDNEVNGAE